MDTQGHRRRAYRIKYVPEADALVIELTTAKALVIDHAEQCQQGICVGLDPETGRVKLITVLRYRAEQRAETEAVHRLLKRFGVTIPRDLRQLGGG